MEKSDVLYRLGDVQNLYLASNPYLSCNVPPTIDFSKIRLYQITEQPNTNQQTNLMQMENILDALQVAGLM